MNYVKGLSIREPGTTELAYATGYVIQVTGSGQHQSADSFLSVSTLSTYVSTITYNGGTRPALAL